MLICINDITQCSDDLDEFCTWCDVIAIWTLHREANYCKHQDYVEQSNICSVLLIMCVCYTSLFDQNLSIENIQNLSIENILGLQFVLVDILKLSLVVGN